MKHVKIIQSEDKEPFEAQVERMYLTYNVLEVQYSFSAYHYNRFEYTCMIIYQDKEKKEKDIEDFLKGFIG